jgi:DNA-binding PadR family transcriptional regulator
MTNSTTADFIPLTPATFHILLTLVDGVRHGYRIKREVEDRTGGTIRLGAGTLYEGIQRMDKKGLIEEVDAPSEAEAEAGSRWRFYGITILGSAVLKAELARLESDVAAARAKLIGSQPGAAP